MKIVDRVTFLALPADTLFSKYTPCSMDELMIKGDSLTYDDFLCQQIADAIKHNAYGFSATLVDSRHNGTSISMDFDCQSRDGCFDADQLFAVWERADVAALIARLQRTLDTPTEGERHE